VRSTESTMSKSTTGTEPLSRNKRLLETRRVEVKGGYVTVTYPRHICSRNQAWQHLCRRPPHEVGKFRHHSHNPWTKHHGGDGWSWSAEVNGVEIAKEEVEAALTREES
jgi:hypothetical protein